MVSKPADVYARDAEWARLERFAADPRRGATLGLVYGRRRQGKTLLVESLAEATRGFYHMALEQEEALALRGLGADIARRIGAPGPIALGDWSQTIDALLDLEQPGRRPVTVVLDEFPYLVSASPQLPSVIQRAFGPRSPRRMSSRARLILCGSAPSVMGRLLGGAAPLRGRAGLELLLQPFDFREAAGFWGLERRSVLAFLVHAVLGGTPAYRELLRGEAPSSMRDFDRWVARGILDPAGPLFREGRYLLAEEPGLEDRALYHSVLTAIVEGRTRPGQIAAVLGRPQTALAHPLKVLEDIRLVRREEDAVRSRRSTYHVAEPLVRFHHAVVRPHLARLERGAGAQVWEEARSAFHSQVLGPHFEETARWWTAVYASRETLGGRAATVGKTVVLDRAGRSAHEVDVVAVAAARPGGRRRILALGEARWGPARLGVDELERLVRVRDLLSERGRVEAKGARLLMFGSVGFTTGLRRRAARGEAELIDAERLYEGS